MKNYIQRFAILFILFWFAKTSSQAQYLHRSGKQIVDGNGSPILLRGMGLGGWMLQEPYMLETGGFTSTQTQIRAKITDLIGADNTQAFYDAWLANHCTRHDIDSLAKWGFNSVRLPMHFNLFTLPADKEPVSGQNTWLEKGFAMTDSLLNWCEANHIYLILDLHATPGGQGNDIAISDRDASKPSLWQSDENQKKTIALWRKLAARYANEKWIGGYDLINEPNWNFTPGANQNGCSETTNAPLRQLYVSITAAIREVDKNHMVIFEGNCWANNHSGLLPAWDDNTVLSFHKYWNNNDQGAIQGVINLRDQYNIPLWLGESGENSDVWFRDAIKLMEDNNIGWAWWPLKKVNSIVNPLGIVKNDGYDKLLRYWGGGGAAPSVADAKTALMELTNNLKIENNIFHPEVIDAMFRQIHDDNTLPFKNHHAPGVVHASDFDLGRAGKAYYDTDSGTYQVSIGGDYMAWNSGWTYRNDAVDLQVNVDPDADANKLNIGSTVAGEWSLYTVQVDSTGGYTINIRYAASVNTSAIRIFIDGVDRSGVIQLPSTNTNLNWKTIAVNDVLLEKGTRKIKVLFEKGGANFSFMKFVLSKKKEELPFKAVAAETVSSAKDIRVSFNKQVNTSTVVKDGFTVLVNHTSTPITDIASADQNNSIILSIDKTLDDGDTIVVNYNADQLTADDGTLLTDFSDLKVFNTLPIHYAIPGKVEAEDFYVNQGLVLENTSDTGAGLDLGYTNIGDFLKYRIRVVADADYTVEARVACNSHAGKLQFQQLAEDGTVLSSATLEVPVTGGWQTWTTVSTKMSLKKGTGILKVQILQTEFNFNWYNFTQVVVNGIQKKKSQNTIKVFPNPATHEVSLELSDAAFAHANAFTIRNMHGVPVRRYDNVSRDQLSALTLEGLSAGIYLLQFETGEKSWTGKLLVK
jgi:endoglucanase